MRMKQTLAVCLLLAALLCLGGVQPALAAQIDPAQMKALEAEADRDFGLCIVEKKVVEECISTSDIGGLTDVLAFTLENRSQDTIQAFALKFVGYDETNQTQDVTASGISISIGDYREIQTLTKDGLSLAPGERVVVSVEVNYDKFKGVRAMVAAYTPAGGEAVSNPSYGMWENLAYGLSGDSVTELD